MRTFLLLFYLSISSLSWAFAEVAKGEKSIDSLKLPSNPSGGGLDNNDDEISSDGFIEENPDYVQPDLGEDSSDSESDFDSDYDFDSDDDGSEDDDDDDGDDDAKTKMSKKLKRSKKGGNGPFKLLKKNKMKITIALAVFAFRNEICMIIVKLLGLSTSEGAATNILKLLLFVDFMRRMQSGGSAVGDLGRPTMAKTIGALINKAFDSNPAYVPPINQHFCFER